MIPPEEERAMQEYEQHLAMREQLEQEAQQFAIHFKGFAKSDEAEAKNILMYLISKCFEVEQQKPVQQSEIENPDDLPF